MNATIIVQDALLLANMVLDQGGSLNTRIAGNGPTIGEVISRALCYSVGEDKTKLDELYETLRHGGKR